MRRHRAIALMLPAVLAVTISLHAEQEPETSRKVVTRVVPAYPALARQVHAFGSVKLEAVVGTDGTVKTVSVRGGHPVLVDAAETAVRKWKYAPAKVESTETIEVHFDPQ